MSDKNKDLKPGDPGYVEKNEKKEETEVVSKTALAAILKRIEDQDKVIAGHSKEIERVTYAADKSRLGVYDKKNAAGELIRTCNVATIDGSIVMGWGNMITDEVYVTPEGKVVEKQIMEIFYQNPDFDKTKEADDKKNSRILKKQYDYLAFFRAIRREKGEIIKDERGEDGHFKTIRLGNGNEVKLDIRFINV